MAQGKHQGGSVLDRGLRLFADVRAGEGATALLLASNVFLALTAYYIIKPVRDGLVIAAHGAEMRSYLAPAIVLVLALVVPAYGRLADNVPRRKLINLVTWIFAASLGLFALAGQLGYEFPIVFFVFGSIFNVMIVAQVWSFANDLYSRDQGERLFAIVAFGGSLGAVLGATVVRQMISDSGLFMPLALAGVVLVAGLQVTNFVDTRERRRQESHLPDIKTTLTIAATGAFKMPRTLEELERAAEVEREAHEAQQRGEVVEDYDAPASGESSFSLVFRTRYLLLICVLTMLLNWVNTNGEFILGNLVSEIANTAVDSGTAGGMNVSEYVSNFYAGFYSVVNLAGLLIQLLLVSRIIKWAGVPLAVMILPALSLGTNGIIAFLPIMAAVRWSKTAENSTDYSLNKTVTAMLFLPTTREQKYKAKQVSDSFFWRAGDMLSTATVLIGTTYLQLGTRGFALFNLVLALVWLAVAFVIGRQYARFVASGQPPTPRRRRVRGALGAAGSR